MCTSKKPQNDQRPNILRCTHRGIEYSEEGVGEYEQRSATQDFGHLPADLDEHLINISF